MMPPVTKDVTAGRGEDRELYGADRVEDLR